MQLSSICRNSLIAVITAGFCAPSFSQKPITEAGVVVGLTKPKYRTRKGTGDMAGSNIFSRDLGTQDATIHSGAWLRATRDKQRLTLGFRALETTGSGTLPNETFFDGTTVPAGSRVRAEAEFVHLKLEWQRLFTLDHHLRLNAGVALEYMLFDEDTSFGSSRLEGVYPTPQLALNYEVMPTWEIETRFGGMYVPFRNGSTEISQPYELHVCLRKRWRRYSAEVGANMYHVHLEQDAGDIDEEIVHMRLRGFFAAFGITF